MRISTNQFYQRGINTMLDQQAAVLRLQQQVATEKRVLSASDDPIAAAQISLMKQRLQSHQGLEENRITAEFALKSEESVMSNAVGIMQKIRTLQIQAGNPALTDDDRKAIATQAQSLLNSMYNEVANFKEENGNYIFAGAKTSVQRKVSAKINHICSRSWISCNWNFIVIY